MADTCACPTGMTGSDTNGNGLFEPTECTSVLGEVITTAPTPAVAPAPQVSPATLPRTGAETPGLIAAASALLLLGYSLVVLSNRRRDAVMGL
jgi:LPXTG-motif cell wall-anchored protein